MINKKGKRQIINNIKQLNLEIDYDKLAESIVKANDKASADKEKTKNENHSKDNQSTFQLILDVILNKRKTNGQILSSSMAKLMQGLFNFLAIVFFALGISGIGFMSRTIYNMFVNHMITYNDITYLISYIFVSVILFLTSFIMRAIANDIGNETDKNYIVSVMSSIVGLAALIVAMIALFKGVG